MIIAEMLGWWYSRGWVWMAQQIYSVELKKLVEFFSISDLLKTLFAPFRQDFIDTSKAPVGVKLQVFGTNLISRVIGAMIRISLISAGIFCAIIFTIIGFIALIVWPFVPIMPVISILLMNGLL